MQILLAPPSRFVLGLRTVVAATDVIEDGSHQLPDTAEGSSPDTLVSNLREEAFHQIEPGSARGREVPVIPGVCGKPGLHRRMGVGGIVVEDEMNCQPTWRAALDPRQKA